MNLDKINAIKRNLFPVALVELVAGLFMIVFNNKSIEMLIKLFGIVAAAYGVITFFTWIVKKDKSGGVTAIITSVLGAVAGACLIFLTDSVIGFFTLIAGIFLGIYGVLKLPNAIGFKRGGFKKWFLILIAIALIVGLGIFVGLNPNGGAERLEKYAERYYKRKAEACAEKK
ncbi:MAG: DUF308 domain-containing protein [Lachnospiraceae bacterium]|nr:DUF308 domain-containing protein [Lachnospiraceae bacterium]